MMIRRYPISDMVSRDYFDLNGLIKMYGNLTINLLGLRRPDMSCHPTSGKQCRHCDCNHCKYFWCLPFRHL